MRAVGVSVPLRGCVGMHVFMHSQGGRESAFSLQGNLLLLAQLLSLGVTTVQTAVPALLII